MSSNKYKLLAFDIDGTILDADGNICQSLKDTLSYLQKRNYQCVLVSARIPKSVLVLASELNIDTVISLNGSFITNQKHDIIYSNSFTTDTFINNINTLDKRISRNYYYHFDWMLEYSNEHSMQEIEFHKSISKPVDKLDISNLNKITLIGDNDLLQTAQKELQSKTDLLVNFSHTHFLEVTDKKVSKYSGLEYLANNHLNIKVEEIIAFGDGENDIPMLQSVGLGVAMGNASSYVKSHACDVADNHDNQGVAKYLEQLIKNKVL